MDQGLRSGARAAVLVLGANETGSAIAVALHRAGYAAVLIDEIDPPWHRRGMALTDAWYLGGASLDGADAVFCASLRSIPAVLDRKRAIAATTWSWRGVAAALHSMAVVDARQPERTPAVLAGECAASLRGKAGGDRADNASGVDAKVDAAAGPGDPPLARSSTGGPDAPGLVLAAEAGRFFTTRRIGEVVGAGEHLGTLGYTRILAPVGGVLRGLAAPGARMAKDRPLIEIDRSGDPASCFGLEARSHAIALRVLAALLEARPEAVDALAERDC